MRCTIYLFLAFFLLGCTSTERDEASSAHPRLGAAPPSAPVWLAFDTLDRPVRFDPVTGAILATGPPLAGVDRDLALDPWTGGVAVFTSPEGDGGAVHRLSPELLADGGDFPIDGRVELSFGPEGLWLFEESYGERWRRIRRDGQPEPSWGLPPPSSVWRAGSTSFGALVDDAGQVTWLGVDPFASTMPATAIAFPGVAPTAGKARATPLPEGIALAWTVAGGIVICVVDVSGAVIHERVLARPGIVRQAATLITDHGPWVALALLDEADPTAASTVVALDPYADTVTADHVLNGPVSSDRRVDRRMSADGDRLIVATAAGLEALVLTTSPPALSLDPGFSGGLLRGPIERESTMFFHDEGPSGL